MLIICINISPTDKYFLSDLAFNKAKTLFEADCRISEFGTRRRRSFKAQEIVIQAFVRASLEVPSKGGLAGTSNVTKLISWLPVFYVIYTRCRFISPKGITSHLSAQLRSALAADLSFPVITHTIFVVNGSWVYDLTWLRECITDLGLDGRNEGLRTGQHHGAENVGRGL